MVSFFPLPKNLSDQPNPVIRKSWDNRKIRLRFSFAVFATLLIIIGCELSSPNYSVTTRFVENILVKSDTLNGIFTQGWTKKFFISHFDKETNLPIYQGSTVKFTIFFGLFSLISLHYLLNDPLSDSGLLRGLSSADNISHPPHLFRFLPEIKFYATHCPSNTLPSRCAECVTVGCANRLAAGEERKTYHWNKIFASLPGSMINHLLFITHKCRFILYLRYTLWASSSVLVVIYLLARLFERHVGLEFNFNPELFWYILILWSIGWVFGFLNPATDSRCSGVWGQFKESVSQLLHTDDFKKSFGESVCRHNNQGFRYTANSTSTQTAMQYTAGSELQTLVTVISYLDHVVKQKLLRILMQNGSISDKDSLRNILTALVEMFVMLNSETCRFRAVLLVPSNSDEFLAPLVTVPFVDQPFLTFSKTHDYEKNLSKTSSSVSSIAWQSMNTQSGSGAEINFFHEGQSEYLKSIIAAPLIVDRKVQELFSEKGIKLDAVIGVICLDCDNEEILNKKSQPLNEVFIKPFANRLLFEMLFATSKRADQ